MSRSTWACELKLLLPAVSNIAHSHAPRERVSWNTPHKFRHTFASVTLHVSVWVEITWFCLYSLFALVTLHVSVWVEIKQIVTVNADPESHAPRERVSWNFHKRDICVTSISHAPRERVSWNSFPYSCTYQVASHAPRERVSWNRSDAGLDCYIIRHAPRERVSWNHKHFRQVFVKFVSRSTWACELK